MTPKFSSYLDAVRFLAALTVFLGHAAGKYWTGGLLWRLGAYGDTCVVVFFVLSGFVIAYVCDTKERAWQVYTANRVARLWSVVLPALVLTFVIDFAGIRVAPALYVGQPWFSGDHPMLHYAASLFMVQEIWQLDWLPGVNGPFWSLSYEAMYYLVFGLLFFFAGRSKWLLCGAVLLCAGPVITLLFPIWGIGYAAYHVSKSYAPSRPVSIVLFLVGLGLLIFSPPLRATLPVKLEVMGQATLARYIDAIGFTMNLAGARGLTGSANPAPRWLQATIAKVAASTFVLYLFHRPLIQFFSYAGPADASGWPRRCLVIGGTLAVVAAATPATERLRRYLRTASMRILCNWYPLAANRLNGHEKGQVANPAQNRVSKADERAS